jgi:hypothetical protein
MFCSVLVDQRETSAKTVNPYGAVDVEQVVGQVASNETNTLAQVHQHASARLNPVVGQAQELK